MGIDARPPHASITPAAPCLGMSERAVLRTLTDSVGRVVGRDELARRSGLERLHARRCDAVIVTLRRVLGAESIRTVRRRGWMLQPHLAGRAEGLLTD